MFRENLRTFLERECTPEFVRKLWETDSGRSPELWAKLVELGLVGMLIPESQGGLGMNEVDLVLLLEETGRVALPAPIVETAAVGVPLLRDVGGARSDVWLSRIAAGDAIVSVGHHLSPVVADAHTADGLVLEAEDGVHLVEKEQVRLTPQPCSDASRRLFTVAFDSSEDTLLARGEEACRLMGAAVDRGALAVAAQQLGIAQRMVEVAADYAKQREQFGKPIGSFQAIKHMLASVQVAIEFARPLVYRAAHAIAHAEASRSIDVSQANAAASDAAHRSAATALQVHGGIGYTWEVDLHLWMKRAWALEAAFGSRRWHRRRIATAILDEDAPAPSFGFQAPGG